MSARTTWLARNGPWLLLAFISIGIAELPTGSTPLLAAHTNPFGIPSLLGYYGAGVLAIREVFLFVFAVPSAFGPEEFLMPIVVGGAVFLLWRLWRRVRRRALSAVPRGAGPLEPSAFSTTGFG